METVLKQSDLEAFGEIVSTKALELKLVETTVADNEEQQHKAVKRVFVDLIQILLGYVGEEEAAGIF